jgi:hypothetical protein
MIAALGTSLARSIGIAAFALSYEGAFAFVALCRELHTSKDKRRISPHEAIEKYFPEAEVASEEDRKCIEERQHFGAVPRDVLVNRNRCRHGFPQAMVLYPVTPQGKMSSGSLRLTCPHLVKAIDEYEAAGGIDEFNQELRSNPAWQEDFRRTNAVWRAARSDMMDSKDLEHVNIALDDKAHVFLDSGIIGVAPGKVHDVKCLHAHLADHLVRGRNVIGEHVQSKLLAKGISLDGNSECWQQCDRKCDAKQAGWWYMPSKNKFKFLRKRLRKHNPLEAENNFRVDSIDGVGNGDPHPGLAAPQKR